MRCIVIIIITMTATVHARTTRACRIAAFATRAFAAESHNPPCHHSPSSLSQVLSLPFLMKRQTLAASKWFTDTLTLESQRGNTTISVLFMPFYLDDHVKRLTDQKAEGEERDTHTFTHAMRWLIVLELLPFHLKK